jgi:nucleoside-diphosphate-sugar epimerase
MSRVLITGATGFVGLNIVEALHARGDEVIAVGHAQPAMVAYERLDGVTWEIADLTEGGAIEPLFAALKPELVINGAALTPGIEREAAQAAQTVAVNVFATQRTLDLAIKHGARRFLYLSSASAYGTPPPDAAVMDEVTTPCDPHTVYSITKFAAERLVLRRARDIPVCAARLTSIFGPWEQGNAERETTSALMELVRRARSGRPAVLPRAHVRDWLYSRDMAAAVLALLDRPDGEPRIVNVAPGWSASLTAWCEALQQRFPAFAWRVGAPADIDVYSTSDRPPLATRLLHDVVGFTPRFTLQTALSDYLAWLDATPDYG